MLDTSLKDQLKNIFAVLEARYTLDIAVAPQHESWQELTEMLADVAECSDKISCQIKEGKELEFSLLKNGEPTGIKFRGVPNGHEFTSLLLAIMNADGKGKNFPSFVPYFGYPVDCCSQRNRALADFFFRRPRRSGGAQGQPQHRRCL